MKKLIAVLACTIILATVIPLVASAASNAAKFDSLKLKDVKAYDTGLPKKGTKKTYNQIEALLMKIPYKPTGKGSTTYSAYLYFGGETSAPKGNYDYVDKVKSWEKAIGKNKFISYYSEITSLMESTGTSCYLYTEDSKYCYNYSWRKGSKEGSLYKYKKTSNSSSASAGTTIYQVYPDATFLGDKCFVHSWEYKEGKDTYSKHYWTSRKIGVNMKVVRVENDFIATFVYFVVQNEEKKDSFFTPPKLKWTEEKGSIFEKRSEIYQPRHP
jgi:hypothetical protein